MQDAVWVPYGLYPKHGKEGAIVEDFELKDVAGVKDVAGLIVELAVGT